MNNVSVRLVWEDMLWHIFAQADVAPPDEPRERH